MSDLIRRKKIRDYIKGEINPYGKSFEGTAYELGLKIIRYIDSMDSDYDIDKVVSELKTDSSVKLYGSQNSDNYMIPVKRAIEIVKNDGVGIETETIRDKAVKWNNNSSKRVPYEFIDYVEGKREICVSDDVCEWKYNDSEYYFESSCEHLHIFMSDGPKENEYRFCPYCGKKIKIVGD